MCTLLPNQSSTANKMCSEEKTNPESKKSNFKHVEIITGMYDEGLTTTTDDSGGSSSEGGQYEEIHRITEARKLSAQSGTSQGHSRTSSVKSIGFRSTASMLERLKDNVTRTTQFLAELKTLSEACQEHIPAIDMGKRDDADMVCKDRQVFIRRIVQISAELQDAKDTVLTICKDNMPLRHWKLLLDLAGPINSAEDRGGDAHEDEYVVEMMMNSSFNLDPSVRFFGIEWEQVFGRCFGLSLNVKIFGQQVSNSIESMRSSNVATPIDMILVNTLLKDFSMLEADVTSHAEAVLHGRLSKSQQRLIRQEQLKNCQPLNHESEKIKKSSNQSNSKVLIKRVTSGTNLTKSKSMRHPQSPKTPVFMDRKLSERPVHKYRKSQTTNLESKFSEIQEESLSASPVLDRTSACKNERICAKANSKTNNICDDKFPFQNSGAMNKDNEGRSCFEMTQINHNDSHPFPLQCKAGKQGSEDDCNATLVAENQRQTAKRKISIFQNVSSIFKNIR